MATWFTSDTHFGQERTFKYSKRGMYFESLKEADATMVANWNRVVDHGDTVYHLGDFGDYDRAQDLNGNIHLLFGNYERDGIGGAITDEQRELFDSITEINCLFLVHPLLYLTHEPSHMKGKKLEENGYFGLFGHIHEKQKVKRNALNVGVDVHNFTPVSMETVEFYRKAINEVYDDECFDTFL